jgi:hypothetical protein
MKKSVRFSILGFCLIFWVSLSYSQCINGTNITCGQTISNINLPNPGSGGGSDPTSGNNGCNPCCYQRADLNNDGMQDVNFSVENPRYYDLVLPAGYSGDVIITINTSNANNLQGAVFNCTQAGNDLNCGHAGSDVHDSSPGGMGPFTLTSQNAVAGNTLLIMIDSYGGCCTGPFDITVNCVGLAIELVSHEIQVEPTGNTLSWLVANENDASAYRLERIRDGSVEKEIRIESNGQTSFQIIDEVGGGGLLYKLFAVDLNGGENVLFTEYVRSTEPGSNHTGVKLESPAFNQGMVSGTILFSESPGQGFAELSLFSMSGARIFTKELVLFPGENKFEIPASLASGIYSIEVKAADGADAAKLLVSEQD